MEIQAITGQHGIGKIAWNAKNKGQHIKNRILLSAGREALKKAIKSNWFGLATLLWANFYRSAKGDRSLLKKWQIGWYNAGAKDSDFWTLYHNAETGSKKKVKFAKLSSKFGLLNKLQQKLKSKGLGAAQAAALPVWVASLVAIISALSGLFMALSSSGISSDDLASGGGLDDIFSQGGNGGNGGNGNGGENGLQLGSVAIPLLLIGGLFLMKDKK